VRPLRTPTMCTMPSPARCRCRSPWKS